MSLTSSPKLANYETTLESTESRLRGLESSESTLEKRLTSSQSNQDAIRTLESKLDAVNSNLKDMTTEKVGCYSIMRRVLTTAQ